MKVAVFSDVQAVVPALEAVIEHIDAWRPELVIMAGDLVNRGPDSGGCLTLFDAMRRSHGWLPVNGNHEAWVLRCGDTAPKSDGDRDLRRFTDWAWRQVAAQADRLRGWPDHLCLHPPGADAWLHVTHGTMAGNRDGITPGTPDESLQGKLPEGVALFVSGHTHRTHQRHTQGMDVVNVGSVGSPFDGDVRGSYGRFTWRGGRWHTELVRFPYDRERAARDFENSGFLDEGGALARLVYLEWQRAELLMSGWRCRYEQAVLRGEVSLEASVTRYLRDCA
ncbi:MAG: metallophosphatase family protein [Thiohalocapsa sp.]|jgi:predicted phosphodiesterase|uniref:metallophosphoesterase family protein n=1 Tax=Thiohalocapsa sp. TaxID=2497641 RepID=UPI0025E7674C|nr:metallophosphoesterase [Thiohalocapsa sp.]MCG6942309.1 metallophosphatase family protein [Thiohalocapsa sp.]